MKDTFYLNLSTADHIGIGLFKCSLGPEKRFIIVNSALAHMLGFYSKRDLKKQSLDSLFVDPQDAEKFFFQILPDKKVKFFEAKFKKSNGEMIWVALTASCVFSRDHKEYLEGIIEDVSAHKVMEENLFLERNFLQGLLDNIPDAIYFKDRSNRIIKVNKFYSQGLKLNSEEIIGKTDFDFFPKDQAEKMADDDNSVLSTGKSIIGKIERTLLPNGTWNQVITTKIPMYDAAGAIIGTMGITRDMTAYANLEKQRLDMLVNALKVLGKVLERRDPYTFSHNCNVASIAERIARVLGWEDNRLLGIHLAGELHDLGKISIPLDILNKPGQLSDIEYQLIQEHVQNVYDIIKDIEFPFSLADMIYQHHERLDGSGYPRKLTADNISVEGRILAVSDVLESMTSYRPYREALGLQRAVDELQAGSGIKYDADIVRIALEIINESGGKAFWLN